MCTTNPSACVSLLILFIDCVSEKHPHRVLFKHACHKYHISADGFLDDSDATDVEAEVAQVSVRTPVPVCACETISRRTCSVDSFCLISC